MMNTSKPDQKKQEAPHAPGAGSDKQHPKDNELEEYPIKKEKKE